MKKKSSPTSGKHESNDTVHPRIRDLLLSSRIALTSPQFDNRTAMFALLGRYEKPVAATTARPN